MNVSVIKAHRNYTQVWQQWLSIVMVVFLAIVFSAGTSALESDRNQPADIEADDTTIDFKTGKRTFNGNVIVIQGTLRIKADKVIANYNEGKIINATAWGKVARFKSRPDGKTEDVEGSAEKIFVNQLKNTLTLTGKARLKQGYNTADGEVIVYNMANDTLKIKNSKLGSGGNTGKERPKRKLEDPFKDDPLPSSAQKKPDTKSQAPSSKKTIDPVQTDDATSAPQIEAAPSGRSRLIIQPKPKKQEDDKN
ncbi:MAG: lipopolysaccharide transport periplasmic protein LptA [Gammaproteobacteria bacterium]|nr:lipopolysaccharide transport periplasmic protein LptA [Gammaproteobacteria bacterium]